MDQTLSVSQITERTPEITYLSLEEVYQSPSNDSALVMRRPVGGMVSGDIPVNHIYSISINIR